MFFSMAAKCLSCWLNDLVTHSLMFTEMLCALLPSLTHLLNQMDHFTNTRNVFLLCSPRKPSAFLHTHTIHHSSVIEVYSTSVCLLDTRAFTRLCHVGLTDSAAGGVIRFTHYASYFAFSITSRYQSDYNWVS